jgi:hypothetical protein
MTIICSRADLNRRWPGGVSGSKDPSAACRRADGVLPARGDRAMARVAGGFGFQPLHDELTMLLEGAKVMLEGLQQQFAFGRGAASVLGCFHDLPLPGDTLLRLRDMPVSFGEMPALLVAIHLR